MFYLFLTLLLFTGAFWQIYTQKPIGKKTIIVLFLVFWLVAGLAWETGVDWEIYSQIFEQSNSIDKALTGAGVYDKYAGVLVEPGYAFLSSLAITITNNYQFMQCLALLIASVFFFKGIKRYTSNYYIALLLYLGYIYLTLNMSGLRQAISLSIFFYALQFIESRRLSRYLILILIASSIHYSSLLLIPLYWIINRKIPLKIIILLTSIGLALYLLRIPPISGVIIKISETSNNPIIYKVFQYITKTDGKLPDISIKMFLNIFMLVMLLMRREKLININKYTNIFTNLFFLYILFGEYLWDTGDVVIRMQHYLILGLIIIIPIYMDSLRFLGNKIICLIYVLILVIWSSNPIFLESPGGLPYNPYQNYILYILTDKESTGADRLERWENLNE